MYRVGVSPARTRPRRRDDDDDARESAARATVTTDVSRAYRVVVVHARVRVDASRARVERGVERDAMRRRR